MPFFTSPLLTIFLQVADDKSIAYQIGDNEPVALDEIAPSMRAYTDATVETLALGYKFGELKADAATAKLKLEMVEGNEKIKATVSTMIQTGSDEFEAESDAFSLKMDAALKKASVAKDALDAFLSCNYPDQVTIPCALVLSPRPAARTFPTLSPRHLARLCAPLACSKNNAFLSSRFSLRYFPRIRFPPTSLSFLRAGAFFGTHK